MTKFTEQFSNYDFPLLGYIKIPKVAIPQEDIKRLNLKNGCSSEDYLNALAIEGFNKKLELGIIPKEKSDIYLKRINYEISEITKLLFTDYILLIYHIIRFCKENGILNSPSRGSCGGSLLLFALDVIKIDAEKHSLLFERFISAGRTEIKEFGGEKYILSANLADVDIDSDRNLKYKINEFVAATFPNKTAPIKTFGTLQGKSAIKEVLKSYEEFKEEDAKEVSNLIETVFGKVEEISVALEDNSKFKEWAEKHKKSVEIAQQINCLIKSASVHASGIIICDTELLENMPLELSSDKKTIVGYDMECAQMFGVKIDNLGLKNLGAIKTCLDLIGKKIDDINVEDKSIYKFLSETNYYRGIFQAEDGLGKSVMKKLKCKNIEDIVLSIAIGRPGSLKFLDEILEVREGRSTRNIDNRIKHILAPTFNIIVYQEQIMALSRVMANFSPQEADGLRKGIGKKIKEKILEYKEKFIERSIKNGFEEKVVVELWQTFEDSGDYLFNRSHSCGYGYLTAICANLKVNHTTEFFYSLLKNAQHESKPLEEIAAISEELPYFNIELLQPHLLKSDADFKIEDTGKIRMGLGNIKSIFKKSLEKLRGFCHQYSSRLDIFQSANQCGVGIGILQNLISAGTMDDYLFGHSRTKLVLQSQLFNCLTPREKKRVLELGAEFNDDLIKIVQHLSKPQNGSDKPFIKERRLNTLREDFKPYQKMYNINSKNEELCSYLKEIELLGFSYSQNLIDILNKFYDNIVSINEAKGELDGSRVTIGGRIIELKSSKSKNGNKYIKINVNDSKDSIDCLIFQHKFEENDRLNDNKKLEEGQLVMVSGSRKGEDAIFADKIVIQDYKIVSRISDLNE